MTVLEFRTLYDQQLRYSAGMLGFRREQTPFVVRYVSLQQNKGFVLWSNLADDNAFGVIHDEIAYFQELGQSFEWKLYDYDQPGNLNDILEQSGFRADEPEAVLGMDWRTVAESPCSGPTAREISDAAEIRDIIRLEEAVWSRSFADLEAKLLRDKKGAPEDLFLYGVYDGGQLVSAAWMYLEPDSLFASLWGGSTLPNYRGLGCYTALLHARGRRAREQGHPYVTVDASAMSRPILERYGFICLAVAQGYQSPE